MRVAVVTDSNSGITRVEAEKLGIKVVPMPFMINGVEYLEDITLTQEGFYEKLMGDADVNTSQPSIGYVTSLWDEVLKEYDQIVYIPMSSGLSKSCESAMYAASSDEYKESVYVVDNQRISITQRQSVLDAIELVKRGYDAKEIKDYLTEVKMQSDIFIMVDTLKYLKKGGRITPAAAAVGGVLKLKPILLIKGEKLDKFKMMNRTVSNARRSLIDAVKDCVNGYLKDLDGRVDNVHIAIAYSGTDNSEALSFKEQVLLDFPGHDIVVNPLSLSVSCHIGPGSLALAVSKAIKD